MHAFTVSGIQESTRIVKDHDTQLSRLEIRQQGQSYPVRAQENTAITELSLADSYAMPYETKVTTWAKVSGIIGLHDSYVLRLFHGMPRCPKQGGVGNAPRNG